jgi:hypothetical protein
MINEQLFQITNIIDEEWIINYFKSPIRIINCRMNLKKPSDGAKEIGQLT